MSWFFASKAAGCAPCCTENELRVDEIQGGRTVKKTEGYEAYNYQAQVPATAALVKTSTTADTFDVTLEGGAHIEEIGLEVSLTDMTVLRIDGIGKGLLAERWNETCPPQQKLVTGDRIVGINGQRAEGPALLDYFLKGSCHTITIQHAEHLHVGVAKNGKKVGLGLNFSKKDWCSYLEIETLNQGLFMDWNDEQEGRGVQVGDRIIEVNGVTGAPQELLGQIARNQTLSLVIVQKIWRDKLR